MDLHCGSYMQCQVMNQEKYKIRGEIKFPQTRPFFIISVSYSHIRYISKYSDPMKQLNCTSLVFLDFVNY